MTRINGTPPPPVPPAVATPPASGRDGRSSRPDAGEAAGRPGTGEAGPTGPGAPSRRAATVGRVAAGAAGLASVALALGAGELVAGLGSSLRSPVEAVATEVIDRAPRPVERFAIETFGTNDKLALIVGTLAITAVLGVVFGIVARRRPLAGTAGFAFFALVGVLASVGAPRAGALAALPSLAAGVAGAATLRLLVPPRFGRLRCRPARSPAAARAHGGPSWVPPRPWRPGRR